MASSFRPAPSPPAGNPDCCTMDGVGVDPVGCLQSTARCRIWTGASQSARSRELRCSPSSPPTVSKPRRRVCLLHLKSSATCRIVRTRSTTSVRLLHGGILLPSRISAAGTCRGFSTRAR
ncbi:uncharacterized protein LOC123396672 [Hordeum vulgare subsp. vulgare]|uniref:uncharacterized protein LOC123396672 n=1 Tax=Hordeum vulgare subsp. vulgare TaxID=112509 RepID=UPI001D1A43F8|nr:uncharacterized protein LOC123396672 [Hordeum vulgare subsp. vulgare]